MYGGTCGAIVEKSVWNRVYEGWISDLPVIWSHNGMFATVDGWENLNKQCEVNVAEQDKDSMVFRLFSGGGQRSHRLNNSPGTDQTTPL